MLGKRRAGLAKDALPSIFDGAPGYLSKKIKSPRKIIRQTCGELSCTSACGKRCEESQAYFLAESAVPEQRAAEANNDVGDATEAQAGYSNKSAFDELFTSASSMCLPSSSWAVHRIDTDGLRDVLFADASVLHASCDGPDVPFNRKSVLIKSDMTVQVFIFGKPVASGDVGISSLATSVSEVEDTVRAVANLDVCSGGTTLKDFPYVTPQCAYIDCQRKWRHNKCPLVSPSSAICRSCRALADTLRIHNDRRIARARQKQPLKCIRLSVMPAEKEKLDTLRKAKAALQRSRARLMKRNQLLAKELQNSRKEIMKLQHEEVRDKLQRLDIPPMQLVLLEECISAARATSAKNRRYSDDWLLLCLLMHVRSPASYSFLRNEVLPLPCVATIRKYISMVGLKCGFDDEFFTALKVKSAEECSSLMKFKSGNKCL